MKSITDVQKSVSAKIQAFKASEKMTYKDMSEITGIHPDSIRGWTYCNNAPSLYSAYLLSSAMGMSLDELIHEQV